MGKVRTANKTTDSSKKGATVSRALKKKIARGIIFVEATFNNTKISFTEENGNVVAWTTAAAQGFTSAKKSTPYAASKVAEVLIEKIKAIGVKELDIIVKGVGSGREAAIRSFVNAGFAVLSIKDKTPVPHNGPRRKKPRRI